MEFYLEGRQFDLEDIRRKLIEWLNTADWKRVILRFGTNMIDLERKPHAVRTKQRNEEWMHQHEFPSHQEKFKFRYTWDSRDKDDVLTVMELDWFKNHVYRDARVPIDDRNPVVHRARGFRQFFYEYFWKYDSSGKRFDFRALLAPFLRKVTYHIRDLKYLSQDFFIETLHQDNNGKQWIFDEEGWGFITLSPDMIEGDTMMNFAEIPEKTWADTFRDFKNTKYDTLASVADSVRTGISKAGKYIADPGGYYDPSTPLKFKTPSRPARVVEDDVCAICFGAEDDPVLQPLSCGHVFHSKCIRDWYESRLRGPRRVTKRELTCPVCMQHALGGRSRRRSRSRKAVRTKSKSVGVRRRKRSVSVKKKRSKKACK